MQVTRRNKLFGAVATVVLVAAGGSWAVLADDGTSAPETVSSPAAATPAGDPTDDPAAQAGEGSQDGKGRPSGKDGAGKDAHGEEHAQHGSGDAGEDPTDDPSSEPTQESTQESTEDATDSSDEESDEEVTVTLGTGDTVEVEPVQTEAPVPLDDVADFGTGLTVRLSDVTAAQAEAKAPGEIAGPAVQVVVEAVNDGDAEVSLDGVVVFLSYGGDRMPASQFGSSSDPLVGALAAGESRTGTYLYAVPPEGRSDLRVEISYTGSAPTVAFEGSVDD